MAACAVIGSLLVLPIGGSPVAYLLAPDGHFCVVLVQVCVAVENMFVYLAHKRHHLMLLVIGRFKEVSHTHPI